MNVGSFAGLAKQLESVSPCLGVLKVAIDQINHEDKRPFSIQIRFDSLQNSKGRKIDSPQSSKSLVRTYIQPTNGKPRKSIHFQWWKHLGCSHWMKSGSTSFLLVLNRIHAWRILIRCRTHIRNSTG